MSAASTATALCVSILGIQPCARLQNLCNMIWGMARLAEHPGPLLMGKYLQKMDDLLDINVYTDDDRDQGIANTLWALTVLDELRPDFVERVRTSHLARIEWEVSHRSMVMQEP